ncbi:MAG TPA: L,D-transpeptidase [Polyangiaceae bacterium]
MNGPPIAHARQLAIVALLALQCQSRAPEEKRPLDATHSGRTSPDGEPGATRSDAADGGSPADGGRADDHLLYVVAGSLDILSSPSVSALVLGTARAGGSVELRAALGPARVDRDCPQGWYEAQPQGFVCPDKGTTRDPLAPAVQLLREYRLAARAALPASYGLSELTPVYLRLPTREEQIRSEQGVEEHLHKLASVRQAQDAARAAGYAVQAKEGLEIYPAGLDVPDPLRGGSFAPLAPKPLLAGSAVTGVLNKGSRVAWVAEFDSGERGWLLTPDLLFVPRDRVKRSIMSGFRGREVPDGAGIAFIGRRPERRYRKSEDGQTFVGDRDPWDPGASVLLAEPGSRFAEEKFLETVEPGIFLRAEDAIVAQPTPPSRWGLEADSRWVEVNTKTNVLLMRDGARVSFATLVSVGSSAVPRGKFRVVSKHLTLASPFDRPKIGGIRAEVPEVMLISDTLDSPISFAMYAAWWTNAWGRSNGGSGIALAPLDARRLFDWTTPRLPDGWHSVRGGGAWVVLHD